MWFQLATPRAEGRGDVMTATIGDDKRARVGLAMTGTGFRLSFHCLLKLVKRASTSISTAKLNKALKTM